MIYTLTYSNIYMYWLLIKKLIIVIYIVHVQCTYVYRVSISIKHSIKYMMYNVHFCTGDIEILCTDIFDGHHTTMGRHTSRTYLHPGMLQTIWSSYVSLIDLFVFYYKTWCYGWLISCKFVRCIKAFYT